ncbi:hypothetical protein KM803_15890 [Clostridium tyrobutyricum]|uniref:hypothetical protein n=1 Tax=Clostridium tyrobutyricum TaxID=1519 RepID=UPI001C386DFE|nr:hypothetical protein [Clostridium tyrobutyricum]MBV4432782.1 hypothetical protein [Clostridium tyrobutyricum]
MDKEQFIVAYNNIIHNIIISDDDFKNLIDMLKNKGTIYYDFIIDTTKSQQQNILNAVYQDMLNYYKIYLGQ